jgi:multidrug efflux pump subunit AcrB
LPWFWYVPTALAGAGAEWKNGLAGNYRRINQFTVLTLIIVPVIYEIMENN